MTAAPTARAPDHVATPADGATRLLAAVREAGRLWMYAASVDIPAIDVWARRAVGRVNMGHLWAVEDPETHYWHARDSSEPAAPDYLALCGESIRVGGQTMLWFDTEAQMRCQDCADEIEAPYRDYDPDSGDGD